MRDILDNMKTAHSILDDYENTKELVAVLELYKRLSLYSVFLWENLSYYKKE